MAFLHITNKFQKSSEPIKETIKKIKLGDTLLKENFINDYKNFIIIYY